VTNGYLANVVSVDSCILPPLNQLTSAALVQIHEITAYSFFLVCRMQFHNSVTATL